MSNRESHQLAAAAAAAAAATAEIAAAGVKAGTAANGNVSGMKASVQTLLNDCYALGACRHGELDDRVLQALASLREADGIQALGEFMRADMSKIRNKSVCPSTLPDPFVGLLRFEFAQVYS